MPDPWRVGAYTESDNALHRRGSGHIRLAIVGIISRCGLKIEANHRNQSKLVLCKP